MRVVAKTTLRKFWEQYPDAQTGLLQWYNKITDSHKTYEKPSDVIQEFYKSDYVGNGRIVFNINRNKYRLIVLFVYETQICYIRFVGTHPEYDKIKDIKNI